MTTLCIADMSLSAQIDLDLAHGEKVLARGRETLSRLSASGNRHVTPCQAGPDALSFLSKAENAAMVEKQVYNHPPLQVCHQGHRPRMYEATGNREVRYYVECSRCQVRSQRATTPDLAAIAWARRYVEPIRGIANHSSVAA